MDDGRKNGAQRNGVSTLSHGATVWLTGRPASGKTTLGGSLESKLRDCGVHADRIDGDDLRRGVCSDLGFSKEDRAENVRRAGLLALDVARSGRVAIVSLVSPYSADRRRVRALHEEEGLPFVEVYVDCPVAVAETRDRKGLYRRARAGELRGFTGIDDPYEAPLSPKMVLHTDLLTVDEETRRLLACLKELGIVRSQSTS